MECSIAEKTTACIPQNVFGQPPATTNKGVPVFPLAKSVTLPRAVPSTIDCSNVISHLYSETLFEFCLGSLSLGSFGVGLGSCSDWKASSVIVSPLGAKACSSSPPWHEQNESKVDLVDMKLFVSHAEESLAVDMKLFVLRSEESRNANKSGNSPIVLSRCVEVRECRLTYSQITVRQARILRNMSPPLLMHASKSTTRIAAATTAITTLSNTMPA
mmetsp:Transcript_100777/g.284198  ORF Transcript_100777/g.284198 Transcript_100777/m.284198 type:complete len:216 (-) Transcript_100777:120-767(-)